MVFMNSTPPLEFILCEMSEISASQLRLFMVKAFIVCAVLPRATPIAAVHCDTSLVGLHSTLYYVVDRRWSCASQAICSVNDSETLRGTLKHTHRQAARDLVPAPLWGHIGRRGLRSAVSDAARLRAGRLPLGCPCTIPSGARSRAPAF